MNCRKIVLDIERPFGKISDHSFEEAIKIQSVDDQLKLNFSTCA